MPRSIHWELLYGQAVEEQIENVPLFDGLRAGDSFGQKAFK